MLDPRFSFLLDPLDEQLWKVQGFVVYDDDTFVNVNGATTSFPRCDIYYDARANVVRRGLYHALATMFHLTRPVVEGMTNLVIADPRMRPTEFQCTKMPLGQSAFPLQYLNKVKPEMEMFLLDELEHGRDPRETLGRVVDRAHVDFVRHMFGIGEHRRKCVPCLAMATAFRIVQGDKDYFTFDGRFSLSPSFFRESVAA